MNLIWSTIKFSWFNTYDYYYLLNVKHWFKFKSFIIMLFQYALKSFLKHTKFHTSFVKWTIKTGNEYGFLT